MLSGEALKWLADRPEGEIKLSCYMYLPGSCADYCFAVVIQLALLELLVLTSKVLL